MFAARSILLNQSAILALRHLLNPSESALPGSSTRDSVTRIESTRFFRISPFCAKCAPVTPAVTALTKHASCNPIGMNTSGKHHQVAKAEPHATDSQKTIYTNFSVTWSDQVARYLQHREPQLLRSSPRPKRPQ